MRKWKLKLKGERRTSFSRGLLKKKTTARKVGFKDVGQRAGQLCKNTSGAEEERVGMWGRKKEQGIGLI